MARTAKPWFNRQRNCWMVWFNGQRVKLVEGKKNKKAAQDRFDELRYEAAHNPHPDSGDAHTVASVIERYQSFAEKRLAASTKACRWPYLQSFAEAHGWRPVTEARPDHVQEWLDRNPAWESDWTKYTAVGSIQAAFNWAYKCRIIGENPFRGASHRAGPPRRSMTEEEFRAILRCTDSEYRKTKPTPGARFRQVLIFLWHTGCRPSEAAKLRWSDIDFDQSLIVLKEHKTIRTQKAPRPRIVPMDAVVIKLLTQLKKRGEGDYAFLTHRKTRWTKNSLVCRIARARDRAGVASDATLYGIRHAFGTRAIMSGVDLKTTSELMGHTTTKMTEHYVHLAGQTAHLAAAMRLANARRRGA